MTKATLLLLYYKFENSNSTFANGEVKDFKEVREVKAICFIAKYTTKRLLAITKIVKPQDKSLFKSFEYMFKGSEYMFKGFR